MLHYVLLTNSLVSICVKTRDGTRELFSREVYDCELHYVLLTNSLVRVPVSPGKTPFTRGKHRVQPVNRNQDI